MRFWKRKSKPESNLVSHARTELALAGLLDKDSDYDGMLGTAALDIVNVFAGQGHSGMSAAMTTDIVTRLMRYEPLTEIGTTPDEWMHIGAEQGGPIYQNRRRSSTFSRDGGTTWYDIEDATRNNGDTWSTS